MVRHLPAVHYPTLVDVIDANGMLAAVIHAGGCGRSSREGDGSARCRRARGLGEGRPRLAIRYTSNPFVSVKNQNNKRE